MRRTQQYLKQRKEKYPKKSDRQPDHGLEQEFLYAVKNNMHDPNVRGAASTAGKWMDMGKGKYSRHSLVKA